MAELSDPTVGLLSAIQIGSPGRVWWGALGMRSLGADQGHGETPGFPEGR